MSEVTKPIALDESFNTTGQTPKNIADVIKNGLQEVAQAIDSHQGGGGHVILDQNGNALDQEPNMQFVDAHTSDDSVNAKTIIENIKSVASADYSSETEDGLYLIPDGDGSVIEPASEDYVEVMGDGVKTYGTLFSELYAKIDMNKITPYAVLQVDILFYNIVRKPPNLRFGLVNSGSGSGATQMAIQLKSSSSECVYVQVTSQTSGNTVVNKIDEIATSGIKLTLYYGNKKAVVDLQTTANRCWLSNGDTVESALTYSTSEHVVGKWIDGKPLYEKTIDCGALPLSTGKTVSHGITGISAVVKFEMVAYGNGQAISIPYFDSTNRCIAYMATGNTGQISIFTSTDAFSSYTKSYAIIRYTKSS